MQEYKTLREVCELLNVSRRRVQGYEKAKLVKSSGKNKYGHLLYDDKSMERISEVKMLQQFGFRIKEIQDLLEAPKEVVLEKLQEKIVILETSRQELDVIIDDAKAFLKKMESGE